MVTARQEAGTDFTHVFRGRVCGEEGGVGGQEFASTCELGLHCGLESVSVSLKLSQAFTDVILSAFSCTRVTSP